MKIEKLTIDGKKESLEVTDKIFSVKINKQLVSNVLYKTNSNYKGRKAKTKQKNEIIGSTSKIWAQKGTGNARHASRKAPIFVGGGVAHGPKGESKDLIIFSDFEQQINKTKEMNSILSKFNAKNSLIILDKKSREKIEKSIRNIPNIKATDINHFSAFDIVKHKKLIFTESSIKELEKRYQ
jgi:large subunit ribosomal protein L4